jgi:hypothetical protein
VSAGACAGPDAAALARLLGEERRRARAAVEPAGDPRRLAAGWTRRFTAVGARADESVALYVELGFEAVADPVVRRDLPDGCDDCEVAGLLAMKTVYTRERKGPTP